jgi:copper(I)-binding protein
MKNAFTTGLALAAAVAMGFPAVLHASQNARPIQVAHAHGDHWQHAQGNGHGHGHARPGPSQEAIAAMPTAAVDISECWIRLLPLPAPSAGYFNAKNSGTDTVTLSGAASKQYGAVMLHQTTHKDGMSRMSSVEGVDIAPGQMLQFKPGGYHIMLEKPAAQIKVGDVVPMQFLFTSGQKAEADCEVKPANTLAK